MLNDDNEQANNRYSFKYQRHYWASRWLLRHNDRLLQQQLASSSAPASADASDACVGRASRTVVHVRTPASVCMTIVNCS